MQKIFSKKNVCVNNIKILLFYEAFNIGNRLLDKSLFHSKIIFVMYGQEVTYLCPFAKTIVQLVA